MAHSLSDWQRIRRYAVPERMIAECAAARERGDWRAACEAARVDVDFDPSLALEAEVAAAHLAPDLLRWHLPRMLNGRTTLAEARFALIPDGSVWAGSVLLTAETPRQHDGHQRIRLTAVRGAAEVFDRTAVAVPAYLWDTRHAARLAVAATWRPADRGMSRRDAFADAGIEIEAGQDETWALIDRDGSLAELDPWRLAHDARWLAGRLWEKTWLVWAFHNWFLRVVVDGEAVRVRWERVYSEKIGPPSLRVDMHRYCADLELVRQGRLAPGSLHPLVREALFPGEPPISADAAAGLSELVRVRAAASGTRSTCASAGSTCWRTTPPTSSGNAPCGPSAVRSAAASPPNRRGTVRRAGCPGGCASTAPTSGSA